MTTVYRIEHHETKLGVYQGLINAGACLDEQYTQEGRHPSPFNDSRFRESARALKIYSVWDDAMMLHYYGFLTPNQLLNWFYNYDDLIRFEDAGFHIAVYEVKSVIEGNTQCAFRRDLATLTLTFSPCKFLDIYGNL